MHYVIDANNLAGELDILDVDNFDLILVEKIRKFIGVKNIKIDLIFDSGDYFGDWNEIGNLEVFYTPQDGFYSCADDKVVEIFKENIKENDTIITVTNDVDLQARIKKIINTANKKKLKIEKSSEFALKLSNRYNKIQDVDKCRGLSTDDIKRINQEMMEIYGNISKK